MEAIREKGFITDRDYAKLVERAKATCALDFQKLISLGLIERKGQGWATYYTLKENLLNCEQNEDDPRKF